MILLTTEGLTTPLSKSYSRNTFGSAKYFFLKTTEKYFDLVLKRILQAKHSAFFFTIIQAIPLKDADVEKGQDIEPATTCPPGRRAPHRHDSCRGWEEA